MPGRFALVVVDPTRGSHLIGQAARWLLSRRRDTRLPCILIGPEEGLNEAPGATLAIRSQPHELDSIRRWLLKNTVPDLVVRCFLGGDADKPSEVDFGQLGGLVGTTNASLIWRPRNLRTLETLRGLLIGRATLRRILAVDSSPGPVRPSIEDYASIYRILQKTTLAAPEESEDELLRIMIDRANHYLKSWEDRLASDPMIHPGRRGMTSRATIRPSSTRSTDRPITLRELTDLGNLHSTSLTTLLEKLIGAGDLEAIRALGLYRDIPAGADPRSLSVKVMRTRLVSWSAKQVRSRFDRLRRQGFIDSKRDPARKRPMGVSHSRRNPAALWRIPEPPEAIEQIERTLLHGQGRGDRVCPPSAQIGGKTETVHRPRDESGEGPRDRPEMRILSLTSRIAPLT